MRHDKIPRMMKHLHREKVSGKMWVDVESLPVRDLLLYEDSDGYFAAVKASERKGVRLYRVVARLAIGKSTDEVLTAIATSKAKAVTTAKKFAAQDRVANGDNRRVER